MGVNVALPLFHFASSISHLPFASSISPGVNTRRGCRNDTYTPRSTHHDGSLRLDTYESQGRVELIHKYEINPTIGYSAFYLDINSNSPNLPRRLFGGSVGFATPIAKFGDWFTAISMGVGYAGDVPL